MTKFKKATSAKMPSLPKEIENNVLSIQEAARIIGVSTKTLRRWEDKGVLIPGRTKGGHRRYDYDNVLSFKAGKRARKKRVYTTSQSFTPQIIAPKASPLVESLPQLYSKLHIDQRRVLQFATLAFVIVLGIFSLTRIKASISREHIDSIKQALNISPKELISPAIEEVAYKEQVEEDILPQVLGISLSNQNFSVNVKSTFNDLATFQQNINVVGDAEIGGTLNLTGNRVISSDDILIDPGGGGLSIGTGTAAVDLTGGDLFVSDDIEAGGFAVLATEIVHQATVDQINAIIDPAVSRFKALDEDDREEFRSLLITFRNASTYMPIVSRLFGGFKPKT